MAYAFDETFAAGIPAGFGSVGGAGGITVSWNAPQQAVDLVFSQAQNVWKITAAQQATDFWFEMDVEIVALPFAPAHFGFWLWDGVGAYEGHRVALYAGLWTHSSWSSTGSQYSWADTTTSALWAVTGSRKTLRLDARKSSQGSVWDYRVSVDGTVVALMTRTEFTAFIPALFGYGCTLRLHRAAGGTPSALAAPAPVSRRLLQAATLRGILVPEHAAARDLTKRGLRLLAGTRNAYYAGPARIAGTVKEKGSPADLPVARQVCLLDEATHILVRATWSDPETGAYAFAQLNPDVRYLVIAYDHRHNYRAVIADRLTAEVPP